MTPPVVPLQVGRSFEQVLDSLIRFFPRLFWSLLVLAIGVGVAVLLSSRAEGAVEESDLFADGLAGPFAYGVKLLLLFFAATIALSELGLNTSVLVVFLDGLAFGLGVAAALAVGIAVGWASKDYVADHVEAWIEDVVDGGGDDLATAGEGGGDGATTVEADGGEEAEGDEAA